MPTMPNIFDSLDLDNTKDLDFDAKADVVEKKPLIPKYLSKVLKGTLNAPLK